MTTQNASAASGRNPQNEDEARGFVAYVESLFMPWNIDALVGGFTDSCAVRFGTLPQFQGRDALRSFFTARMSKQKGYRLRKRFRALHNDVMTNVWDGEWEDAATGTPMRGFGVEAWTMRGGKIAVWEAAFNVAPSSEATDLTRIMSYTGSG